MAAATPECPIPSESFAGRVADEKPQGYADLPAAGRLRPALQVQAGCECRENCKIFPLGVRRIEWAVRPKGAVLMGTLLSIV